jgi:uncharacterized repeat protein (TIGR03833 family)
MKTDSRIRMNITKGAEVLIVLKRDQRTGKLTRGVVKDILTRSANHPQGIKVRLRDGKIGRVYEVVTLESRLSSEGRARGLGT